MEHFRKIDVSLGDEAERILTLLPRYAIIDEYWAKALALLERPDIDVYLDGLKDDAGNPVRSHLQDPGLN